MPFTSRELIISEARRRLTETPNSIPDTAKVWTDELIEWFATTHPDIPRLSPRTMAMYLGRLHRIAKLQKSQR